MKRMFLAAGLAVFTAAGVARAEDTVETLKPQALEACKAEVGPDAPGGADKLCGCMVDNIVTVFGDDAASMLKIVVNKLNPSDIPEIAALLGVSEDEAKAFVEKADANMNKVQEACMPAQ